MTLTCCSNIPLIKKIRYPFVHMAWRSSGETNEELITNLKCNGVITEPRVFSAMLSTDRIHYAKHNPYQDSPQSIGYHATISAPHMHAAALSQLAPVLTPGNKALDVGSGSGYLAVCMAKMMDIATDTRTLVVGIDYIDGLVELGKDNCQRGDPGVANHPNFHLLLGDGWKGVPEYAPYDAIHVGAAAKEVPLSLLEQLSTGGIMVIPVGPEGGDQILMKITKDSHGFIETENLMNVLYVPLVKQ